MTRSVRFGLAAVLGAGLVLPATAATKKKVAETSAMTPVAAAEQLKMVTPFKVWPDDQYIFVVNTGNSDWNGPLDVSAVCTSNIANPQAAVCGPNFPGGKFKKHYATFPAGHGGAPIKGSGNAQQISGYGWIAVFMGLPPGTYKITASAANNSSPETTITIPGMAPTGGIQVGPATVSVKPK